MLQSFDKSQVTVLTFYDEFEKSLIAGKIAAETWHRMFTLSLWQCLDVKYPNGSVIIKTMRSVVQVTL